MPKLHQRLGHHVRHLHHRTVHHLRNAFVPHEGNSYHPHALRHKTLSVTGGVLIAAKLASVAFVAFYAQQAHVSTVTPTAIVTQTNAARKANGVGALSTNSLLQKAAQSKAQDMVTNGYFAHISPTHVTPWYWFKKAGYNYAYAGENLAIDYTSSEDIIAAWLNSPSHRANLLSVRYKDIGVAVASGTINGAESLVVVQMFGAPLKPVVVKKSVPTTQTPTPKQAATTLKQQPVKSTVLGETAPVTAPAAPQIESPGAGTLTRSSAPVIVGQAEPGSTVSVVKNGQVLASGTVPADGVFSLTPTQVLPDGVQSLEVLAAARGKTSVATPMTFTVDTQAPSIVLAQSYMLSGLMPSTEVVSIVASTDTTAMVARSGDAAVPLHRQGDRFVGLVPISTRGAAAGSIALEYSDAAGNAVQMPLLDADHALTGVVAAPAGPMARALSILFFSRTFLLTFFGIVFVVAFMNTTMNWKRHHHPALLGLLLLLYVTGALTIL